MKVHVYLETSVVSYLVARPSRDLVTAAHQQATRELWPCLQDKYLTYVSALVYAEAERGDSGQAQKRLAALRPFVTLTIDAAARLLAAQIIADGGIPREEPEDALHLALAAVNGMEIVLTWNFAHLNNPITRGKVRRSIERAGYACPEICSPEELAEVGR